MNNNDGDKNKRNSNKRLSGRSYDNSFRRSDRDVEYNPNLASIRDAKLAEEKAKRQRLKEELGLSSDDEGGITSDSSDSSGIGDSSEEDRALTYDDDHSYRKSNSSSKMRNKLKTEYSNNKNIVSMKIYQQLHTDYTVALSDVHKIAKRERETQALLDKLLLMSKSKAAILKEKMYQKLHSKDMLLRDMYTHMLELEQKRKDLLSEEQLLSLNEKTVDEYYKDSLAKESKRTKKMQISPTKSDINNSKNEEHQLVEEMEMKLNASNNTIISLENENELLRQHILKLGKDDAKSLALVRKELHHFAKKLETLKNEHESVEKKREDAQLAVAAAVASSSRLKQHTEQLEKEKEGIAKEIYVNKQEKEKRDLEAKKAKENSDILKKISNDLQHDNEQLRLILKEAQNEIIKLKTDISKKDIEINTMKAQIPDPEILQKQANAKELEEFKKRWKDAESKVMDANSEKRAKIKSMGIILEQTQQKLNLEKELSIAKTSEIETLKTQMNLQVTQINETNNENFQYKKDLKSSRDELNQCKQLLVELKEAQEQVIEKLKDEYMMKSKSKIDKLHKTQNELKELLQNEIKTRRKLHKKVMHYEGNIRVYCRIRPPNKTELSKKHANDNNDNGSIVVTTDSRKEDGVININADIQGTKTRHIHTNFEFDAGFHPETTQTVVFERVEPFIISAMDGYNCCIFAYGQTGSGKTFTMQGPLNNRGVNVRALNAMFNEAKLRKESFNTIYTFQISMCEIYNEECYDLLGDKSENGIRPKIKLRQGQKKQVFAEGLSIVDVHSVQDIERIMKLGQENRSVGSHNFNEHSSRSHLVVTVYIKRTGVENDPNSDDKDNADKNRSKISQLHLIDLAGSERLDKTGASGERLKEAQNINKSLSALGDVIGALGARSTSKTKKHVPYRNSKLTWLLSNSLSGNSKVLMLVCVSPTMMCTNETMCSLQFAQRCRATSLGQAKKV